MVKREKKKKKKGAGPEWFVSYDFHTGGSASPTPHILPHTGNSPARVCPLLRLIPSVCSLLGRSGVHRCSAGLPLCSPSTLLRCKGLLKQDCPWARLGVLRLGCGRHVLEREPGVGGICSAWTSLSGGADAWPDPLNRSFSLKRTTCYYSCSCPVQGTLSPSVTVFALGVPNTCPRAALCPLNTELKRAPGNQNGFFSCPKSHIFNCVNHIHPNST